MSSYKWNICTKECKKDSWIKNGILNTNNQKQFTIDTFKQISQLFI